MNTSTFNLGDTVLCYSCEKCRIEKRPRDREAFEGVITKIEGRLITVKHKNGHNLYYDVSCLELVKRNIALQEPIFDADRIKTIRLALIQAYENKDAGAVKNAARLAQSYIDEGGDDNRELDDSLEDYAGSDAVKLADQYILRLLRDRHCDNDSDQTYIESGLTLTMKRYYQYWQFKKKFPDAVLLFRDEIVGYRAYDDDADVLQRRLQVTVEEREGIRTADFSHNSLDIYLPKLVAAGYRVAICDQIEAEKQPVKRGITETVSHKPVTIRKEEVQLSLNF